MDAVVELRLPLYVDTPEEVDVIVELQLRVSSERVLTRAALSCGA